MRLSVAAGAAGVANRGNGDHGLFVQAGKDYEGYFFASFPHAAPAAHRAPATAPVASNPGTPGTPGTPGNPAPVTVRASLYDWQRNTTLGSTTIVLTPNATTTTTGGGGGGGDTTARVYTSPTPGDEADDESMDDAPLDELYPSPAASFTGGHPDGPN